MQAYHCRFLWLLQLMAFSCTDWGALAVLVRSPFILRRSSTQMRWVETSTSWFQLRGGATVARSNKQTTSNVDTQSDNKTYNIIDASSIAVVDDPGSLSLSDLFQKLQSSEDGLSEREAEVRLQHYGRNTLQEETPAKSTWQIILEQFRQDRPAQILLIVAVMTSIFCYFKLRQEQREATEMVEVVSYGIMSYFFGPRRQLSARAKIVAKAWWQSLFIIVEPLIILGILVLNAIFGVVQTKNIAQQEALQKQIQPTNLATVVRQGVWHSGINATQLVPGDMIQVRVGFKIPADARLVEIQSSPLNVNEGSLTTEESSVTLGKLPGDEGAVPPGRPIQDQRGMLYSGTIVTSGAGRAVVVHTGMDTQMAKIHGGCTEAKAQQPKTPLATKLDELGETVTIAIGVICLAVWILARAMWTRVGE